MLCKHLIQKFCTVMERKSHMLHQTLRLFLRQPGETVQLSINFIMLFSHIMKQIIIKILHACFLHLLIKNFISVLFCLNKSRMKLCGKGIAFSGMTAYQNILYCIFTLKCTVHPGGVKICKASLQKSIHHFLCLFYINASCVLRIQKRQTHQTETKFFPGFILIPYCQSNGFINSFIRNQH